MAAAYPPPPAPVDDEAPVIVQNDDLNGLAGAMVAMADEGPQAAGEDGAQGRQEGEAAPPAVDMDPFGLAGGLGGGLAGEAAGAGPNAEGAGGNRALEGDGDGELGAEEELANAAMDAGCGSVFADALPAICSVAGKVTLLTTVMLGNQIVSVNSKVTTLRLAQGVERVQAVSAYADALLGSDRAPPVPKGALSSALLSVLDSVFPPEAAPPDRVATDREGSPDTGFIRKAMAVMAARKEQGSLTSEMSVANMERLAEAVAPLLGFQSQGTSGLGAPSQCKVMYREVVVNKRIPAVVSIDPENMIRAGGDTGVAAPKAEKDKESVTAEPTTSSFELRDRLSTWCITLAACLMDQDDEPEASKRSAALAALGMIQALAKAKNLTSYAQVHFAIQSAVAAARRAQNCDPSMRLGFAAALTKGSDAIFEMDSHVRRTAVPTANATTPEDTAAGPAVVKDLRELIKSMGGGGRGKGGGRGGGGRGGKGGRGDEKSVSRYVKLPDGTRKAFVRMHGGNPDCPVKCTKDHAKASICHFSHADK